MDDERRGYSGPEDDTDWLAELLADVDLGQWEDEPPKQQSTRRESARQTAPRQPQPQPQRQTNTRQAQTDRPRQSRYDGEAPQRPQQVRRQPAYEEESPRRQPRRPQQTRQAPQQRPRQPQYQPQPQRRAPAGQYQDRAARERAVRQVEVRPPAYARRREPRQRQSAVLIVLIVVLAGGMLFAGGKLVSIFLNYHRDRSAYNDLADNVITDLADGEEEDPQATPDPNGQQQQTPTETAPIAVNWDSLRASNSDVVAWIYCPGTPINYPVVQTSDNDFYLHRGVDKQANTSGTLFADKNSSLGITLSNYIIYGHNMKDGSMFATVEDYLDPSFYDQHPEMYLLTPTGNYKVELIAVHIVEASLDNFPGYFSSTADYSTYLGTITSRSSFYSKYPMDTNYQLLTLSTCDYSGNYADPRCLLHGLMVPIG